jgi:AcrR family transcriptional regulator
MASAPERSDARANRQRILEAALEVIAERGAATEIKEVADRAGVGVGTIYRNFATKDDLLRGIIEDLLGRFYAVRDEALALDDPVESIRSYVGGMFRLLERFAPAIMAMISGAFTDEMKMRFMEYAADRKLEAVLHRGIALGVFRKDLPIEIARALLVNACDPLVYLAIKDSLTTEEIAEGYADLLIRALRA